MVDIIKGDITKIEADIIVNAANTELIHGGGVALAIAKAGGEELIKESKKIGFVSLGDFAVTTAGSLRAKKVIHIPTIDYTQNRKRISYEELKTVWQKVLKYCKKESYKTIAVPILGAGVVGLDKEKVKKILFEEAEKFKDLDVKIVEF